MDVEGAVAYVERWGDAIERARLAAILRDEPPSGEALQALEALQREDGGFAPWRKEVSTLSATAFALSWCDDLGLRRGPIVERACRFLIDRQEKDGGWDEVEAVRVYGPPEWMTPGRIETRAWLTASCAHVLLRLGYAEAPGTTCPADFLLAHADASGRLPGYLRATWIALPMLSFYPGRDSEAFRQAVAAVLANYSSDWEGSYLAWLLRCTSDAGLLAAHPLVGRALSDLERKQRSDGAWGAEDGEAFSVSATVDALRAFKAYGRTP